MRIKLQRSPVSKLTPSNEGRRKTDANRPSALSFANWRSRRAVLAGVAITLCAANTVTADDSEWQSNEQIKSVAENYAGTKFGSTDSRVSPVAGHLDPRLRLPKCDRALEPFLRPGTKVTSRTIIGVRCSGSKPWKVYVPVDVAVMQTVLIAKRTFPRGHLLTPADVIAEQRDVSRMVGGYLADLEELNGQRLKQQIIGGRAISPTLLAADIVVRRGQSVTLIVQNEQMNISMTGKALTDGTLNQRIRVENANSRRVVEGLVRSPELVEILVHK